MTQNIWLTMQIANEISYRFHLKYALLRVRFILTCAKFAHLVRTTVGLQKETWGTP